MPEPPAHYTAILDVVVGMRKLLVRHCFLPRPAFLRAEWFSALDPKTGRAHLKRYAAHPWYIAPTLSARWGVKAWIIWAMGGLVPGDEKYQPRGYKVCELGPKKDVGKGAEEMDNMRAELKMRCCAGG